MKEAILQLTDDGLVEVVLDGEVGMNFDENICSVNVIDELLTHLGWNVEVIDSRIPDEEWLEENPQEPYYEENPLSGIED